MLFFDIRHVYNAALDALGKLRRPVEALNVFHAMQVMQLSVQYARFK
jgi:pentatricopeptide repeat protein